MISIDHKAIFIHNPKVAGTSINNLLRKSGFKSRSLHQSKEGSNDNETGEWKIGAGRRIKRGFSEIEWNSYFKFAFVRNPWDRELSNYFFNNKTFLPPEDVSFKEFLNTHLLKGGQIDASNVPQCEYLTDVNYVARFENYAEEVKYLFNRIGLAFPNNLEYTNKTEHKPYWEYYDDADIMKVHEWYEKDIEMYNYEFGE